MHTLATTRHKTLDLVYISLFAVLISICSWISIPGPVPFTMQTFAVFLTVGLLGSRRGLMAILIYILLGAVGLPVFAGFTAGLGVLLSPLGGYLLGFVAGALVMGRMIKDHRGRSWLLAAAMLACLLILYACGTVWNVLIYAPQGGAAAWTATLLIYVVPFIIPDLLKIAAAVALTKRLAPYIRQ